MKIILRKIGADATITFRVITTLTECGDKIGGKVLLKYTDCWIDCALSTEMNLALAAKNYSSDTNVDFETVWGQGHTMAERSGDSTSDFITWVNKCMVK